MDRTKRSSGGRLEFSPDDCCVRTEAATLLGDESSDPAIAFVVEAATVLTIASATIQKSGSRPVGVPADDRIRPIPSATAATGRRDKAAPGHEGRLRRHRTRAARRRVRPAPGEKRVPRWIRAVALVVRPRRGTRALRRPGDHACRRRRPIASPTRDRQFRRGRRDARGEIGKVHVAPHSGTCSGTGAAVLALVAATSCERMPGVLMVVRGSNRHVCLRGASRGPHPARNEAAA
jgi:hypothetical protein